MQAAAPGCVLKMCPRTAKAACTWWFSHCPWRTHCLPRKLLPYPSPSDAKQPSPSMLPWPSSEPQLLRPTVNTLGFGGKSHCSEPNIHPLALQRRSPTIRLSRPLHVEFGKYMSNFLECNTGDTTCSFLSLPNYSCFPFSQILL